MKKSDIKVLSHLRKEGRLPLTELSRKSGLPVSTLHERLRLKVREGVYRPGLLLDFRKLGFGATAFIKLAVTPEEKERLVSYVRACPQVNSLFRINNGWHVLFEVVFRDMRTLEQFVEGLESRFHVRQKEVCYVLDEVEREVFLSDAEVAERVLSER